jgi:arabinofuranosyltransferase
VAWAGVGALAAALLVMGGYRRWDPVVITDDPETAAVDGDLSIDGIANERLVYMLLAGKEHPVTYDDYAAYIEPGLEKLGELPREGELIDLGGSGRFALTDRPMLVAGSIGLVGYHFLGTHVVDQLSLAEPLGAHMEAGEAGRPGHEKILGWEWLIARFAKPSANEPVVEDARAALACGDLAELVDAVDEPLTPGRFLQNLVGAVGRTQLRVPPIPSDARLEFCD